MAGHSFVEPVVVVTGNFFRLVRKLRWAMPLNPQARLDCWMTWFQLQSALTRALGRSGKS